MRRLFIFLIVAILAVGALKAMRHHPGPREPAHRRHHGTTAHDRGIQVDFVPEDARRQAREAAHEARLALAEAGHELRQAYREARDELGRSYREARDEIRHAYRELTADGRPDFPPPGPAVPPAMEEVEGVPVPIVPGTRVTDAEAVPPTPGVLPAPARVAVAPDRAPEPPPPAAAVAATTVEGQICATEDRARNDARDALRIKVAEWLTPDVPASWAPPEGLLESLIVETRIAPIVKDYGTLYRADLAVDLSPGRRAELVDAYNRDLVWSRLMSIGGALAFVLICLAVLSGYIRADEATRGYYTNRLRMLAAAGVGAGGVIVYRMLV